MIRVSLFRLAPASLVVRLFLFIMLGACLSTPSHAQFLSQIFSQTPSDKLAKIETNTLKGKYPSALRKAKRMRRSMDKKGLLSDSLLMYINLAEASSLLGIGDKQQALTLIEQTIVMSDSSNSTNLGLHANILFKAAKLYIDFGYYSKALRSAQQAEPIYLSADNVEAPLLDEITLLKAKINIGQGFYRSGIAMIDTYLTAFVDSTKASELKTTTATKKRYVDALISRANAFRELGEYERADAIFLTNEDFIKDALGKKDIAFIRNKFLQTLMFEENGMEVKPLIKQYEPLYKRASAGRTEGHYLVVDIREKLMSNYYKDEKKSKLIDVQDDMKRTYRRYHKKRNSIYTSFKTYYKFPSKILTADLDGLENDVVNILSLSDGYPEYHERRAELLEIAYLSAINDVNKIDNAEQYRKQIVEIRQELLGEQAPLFHLAKLQLANFYLDYSDNFEEATDIYAESWEQVVSKEFSTTHYSYIETLSHLAILSKEKDEYKQAVGYLDEALYLTRTKWDDTDVRYAEKLGMLARLHIEMGNYTLSREYIDRAKEILKKQKTTEEQKVYLKLLTTEIPLLLIYGDYKEAEDNYKEYYKIKERDEVPIADTGTLLDDVAELYLLLGRYYDVVAKLDESIGFKEQRFGADSRLLIKPLTTYARYHLSQGEFAEAEKKARRALKIARDTYGNASLKQIPPMMSLAMLYKNIGDYPRSEQILSSIIGLQLEKLGDAHTDLGMAYSEYALVRYLAGGSKSEVDSLFQKAETIIGSTLGSNNPYYAEILKNLAIANINAGQYEVSEGYLDLANDIWDKKLSKRKNFHTAGFEMLYGDIRYYQEDYKEAEKYYSRAAKRYESFFNDHHPEYLKATSKLSRSEFMREDHRNAQKTIEEVLHKYQDFIVEYFPSLSEREKAKYWGTIKGDYEFYNNVLITQKKLDEEIVSSMYNNALLTKSLLLSSSIKMKERIMNSGDQQLINLYLEWSENKDKLTSTLAMSDEEMKESGLNVGDLTFALNSLEKELVQKSSVFANTFDSRITIWQDVRNAILPDEVAVEVVRFRHFDQVFTDQVYYAILTLSGELDTPPRLQLLENGREMETKYLNIYRNSMKYKWDDPASYEVYWEPLQNEFSGASTIYLSPDGVYNQINLESIRIPGADDRYVIDKENIILVNNTKDLFFRKLKEDRVRESKIAALFGNPQFYLDTRPGIKIDESGGERATDDVISQLPGTEQEIKEINDILRDNGWLAQDHMFAEATEANIKAIDNPRVFHIATHGFFKVESGTEGSGDKIAREIVHNPLMRSGLLLKGAGDILNTTDYNFNINDGILTAYEAMNLNLDQTELVVLSACETGLGAVEAGEGVFGLQRAFLVAGARAVVMSLFKVSDDATQKLMVQFYKNWLSTGKARESFVSAKKEIRQEYGDPIYWAPFVMIGLN